MSNILFDLDGTLTDPYKGIANSMSYALDKLGAQIPEDFKWCIGPPLQESFKMILKTESVDKPIELYREYFSKRGLFENVIYEGIVELLNSLSSHTLFVATSKPGVYAKKIVEHFKINSHFKFVYGAELDGTRRDKGDLIKYILKKENLSIEDTFMVGDRKHDLIGANKNNIKCIGVTWGYGTYDELESEKPYKICSSVDELGDIFND